MYTGASVGEDVVFLGYSHHQCKNFTIDLTARPNFYDNCILLENTLRTSNMCESQCLKQVRHFSLQTNKTKMISSRGQGPEKHKLKEVQLEIVTIVKYCDLWQYNLTIYNNI